MAHFLKKKENRRLMFFLVSPKLKKDSKAVAYSSYGGTRMRTVLAVSFTFKQTENTSSGHSAFKGSREVCLK